MKNIYLLGATGSIGVQTLDVIRTNPEDFRVVGLSAKTQIDKLIEFIDEFHPEVVCVESQASREMIQARYPNLLVLHGDVGLAQLAKWNSSDANALLVNALVGVAGLRPTVEAIRINRDIALANKESLVVGGPLIQDLLKSHSAKLFPIDSEHSAIWQALRHEEKTTVRKILLTASGGAFRNKSLADLKHVKKEDALKHPTWSMGNKITIDSATLMNKGFEVMEACILFDVRLDQVETIVHPESIIHSMVEFVDGSVIAQLSDHDMRLPIQYALYEGSRKPSNVSPIDFVRLGALTFEKLDLEKVPCFRLAIQSFRQGGLKPAVLNAANEVAVALFLQDKIPFLMIPEIIEDALNHTPNHQNPTLEELLEIDRVVRKSILERVK